MNDRADDAISPIRPATIARESLGERVFAVLGLAAGHSDQREESLR